MKKTLLIWALVILFSQVLFAETKSIILPKGTTIEKLGTGHYKFRLPDGRIVEINNFEPTTGKGNIQIINNSSANTQSIVSGMLLGVEPLNPSTQATYDKASPKLYSQQPEITGVNGNSQVWDSVRIIDQPQVLVYEEK
jgi:hypothetical protein